MRGELSTARNYTRAFSLQTRQHTLLGIDLGEGIPRKPLVFGVVMFAIWIPLLWYLLGAPTRLTSLLFLAPPALVTYFGARPSPGNPRRFRFTSWAITAMFLLRGHRPIIGLGARQPTRAELTPWAARRDLPTIGEIVRPWTRRPEWERNNAQDAELGPTSRPIRVTWKARTLGQNHVAGALERRAKKDKGNAS